MIIVQSLWTKPMLNQKNKLNAGWLNNRHHYMSWALSCLKLKEFYGEVTLVTDRLGKEILIDYLKLPYTHVTVELDSLNNYHSGLFALGKIYTYGIQNEPFIHVDSDIYIWSKFPKEIEDASLIAQNKECNSSLYDPIVESIEKENFTLPLPIQTERKAEKNIFSANTGILGGQDFLFIKEYANTCFDFLHQNKNKLDNINIPKLVLVYEQYLFYCMAKSKQIPINYLINQIDIGKTPTHLVEFWNIPQTKYIHMIAGFKKNDLKLAYLTTRLRLEYPEYYYKITNALKKF